MKNTQNLPSQFKNGQGYADLINLLADGTIPALDLNDSREHIRIQSEYILQLMGTGMQLMQQNKINVRDKFYSIYGVLAGVNLKVGGTGGAFYQNLQSIFNSVKSFIGDQINLQLLTSAGSGGGSDASNNGN